jgi:hypothetical protein
MTQRERDRITVVETKMDAIHGVVLGMAKKLDDYISGRVVCENRFATTEVQMRVLYAVAIVIVSGLIAIFLKK